MNLNDLHDLALTWCPRKARWIDSIESVDSWGPAHELAHALIEPKSRWNKRNYGRCALAFCREHYREQCDTYEIAAMRISRTLLVSVGRVDIAYQEVEDTTDIDLVDTIHVERSVVLLKRKGLWPVPRTMRKLEAALKRRLGKPRGAK